MKKWDGRVTQTVNFWGKKPVIIAGPCMLESLELGLQVGSFVKKLCDELGFSYIFKASYDKANRTSLTSVRGPGVKTGLAWLQQIKDFLGVPVVTDVHTIFQAQQAAEIVDVLQIPAFLCFERDLLLAAAKTDRVVQIKKGQWASAVDMVGVAHFLESQGCSRLTLVERGTCFGYNNLVVDMRNLVDMGAEGHAVVFDATHAVQLPGIGGGKTLGLRNQVAPLARAAVAVGIQGLFMEVHPDPEKALSDAATQLSFPLAEEILRSLA